VGAVPAKVGTDAKDTGLPRQDGLLGPTVIVTAGVPTGVVVTVYASVTETGAVHIPPGVSIRDTTSPPVGAYA